ncbi:MAG: hypothetical protein K2H40_15615 [Lachnospiraceae bacterium]|nr:hypothetical protein [Lachnospiraceae bacterium]
MMTELTIGAYENRLIKGDEDKALEVVENLMENAFKYGDGRQIAISFQEEEGCQLIRIRNTGSVVNAEEMPRLFDSFYRGAMRAPGKEMAWDSISAARSCRKWKGKFLRRRKMRA